MYGIKTEGEDCWEDGIGITQSEEECWESGTMRDENGQVIMT